MFLQDVLNSSSVCLKTSNMTPSKNLKSGKMDLSFILLWLRFKSLKSGICTCLVDHFRGLLQKSLNHLFCTEQPPRQTPVGFNSNLNRDNRNKWKLFASVYEYWLAILEHILFLGTKWYLFNG